MNQVIELQRFSNALFDTLDETSIGAPSFLLFLLHTILARCARRIVC